MKKELPNIEIRKIATLVEVLGISSDKHRTNEYIITLILIPGKAINGCIATAKLAPREIYIVDNLRANILIGIDIITTKDINILASKRVAYITSYEVKISIEVLSTRPPVRRVTSGARSLALKQTL